MCTPFSMNTQQTYPKYRKCNQQLFCIIDVVTFRKEIEWNVVCRCEITSFQLSVTQFHFQIEFHAVCRTILTYKQKLNVINCWTKMNKRQNCVESLWEMQHLIICNKFATVLYQNHWKITKRAWKCERDFYEKKKMKVFDVHYTSHENIRECARCWLDRNQAKWNVQNWDTDDSIIASLARHIESFDFYLLSNRSFYAFDGSMKWRLCSFLLNYRIRNL